ncbi:aldo/keto reductase [Granulosicoccus sp. 3-233]|uniref:aldo/keto reductase n=1 Tax=Granulosicoccus sp. 3-233 TaxID=3417969 RepID=UPI003D325BB6
MISLPRISFGTAAIAGIIEAVDEEQANAVLEQAWASGLRYFDTAPHYGQGLAERRIGDFLRSRHSEDWILSTKVGRLLQADRKARGPLNKFVEPLPFSQHYDYSYDGIMRSVEDSFQRLGLSRIDILYAHDLGTFTHADQADIHLRQFLDSGVRALQELKSQAVIKAFGLGVNDAQVCLDVLHECELDLLLLAGRYTLLDRTAEQTLLPLCKTRNTGLVMGGVLNSGILATGARPGALFNFQPASERVLDHVGRLESLCEQFGIRLAAAAMQFPLRNEQVISVLTGPGRVEYLEENLMLMNQAIPEEFWEAADALRLTS